MVNEVRQSNILLRDLPKQLQDLYSGLEDRWMHWSGGIYGELCFHYDVVCDIDHLCSVTGITSYREIDRLLHELSRYGFWLEGCWEMRGFYLDFPGTFLRCGVLFQESSGMDIYIAACRKNEAPPDIPAPRQSIEQPSKTYASGVYLIHAANGLHKIGKTTNLKQRLANFMTSSPVPLDLVCFIEADDCSSLEMALHKRFDSKRSHLEWFQLDQADVDLIKAMATGQVIAPKWEPMKINWNSHPAPENVKQDESEA